MVSSLILFCASISQEKCEIKLTFNNNLKGNKNKLNDLLVCLEFKLN